MPKTSARRPSMHRVVVACSVALLISPAIASTQIGDPLEEIKACARIESTATRVECYETLGRRALQTEAAPSDSAAMPAAEDAPTATEAADAHAEVPVEESEVPPPPGPAKPAETQVATAETIGKMTDDLGGPEFAKRAGKQIPTYSGVVTSCKKNAHGKYYFYFDNGQIWKQTGGSRLRFRECQFNVTIEKDFGGYVMRIEGKKSRVRIARVD